MLSVQLARGHTRIRTMGKETLVQVHAEELHSLTVFMACCSGKKRVRLIGDIFCGAMKTLCGWILFRGSVIADTETFIEFCENNPQFIKIVYKRSRISHI